jgi:hypothetical protein
MKKTASEFSGKAGGGATDDFIVNNGDTTEQLLTNCFTIPSVAAAFARIKNAWKPTRADFLPDIEASCVEFSHGGLWNQRYDRERMISVDMVACYPASFLGYGECAEYFKRFGHPTHEITRVAINGLLSDCDLTGFAKVSSFEFAAGLHRACYIWIGRHVFEKSWLPTALLRFMIDSAMLISLTVSEAIIS